MRYQRRQRTTFDKYQLDELHEAFRRNHYPEPEFRKELARKTNLDPSRIQVWFQNQRAKDKKRRGSIGANSPTPTLILQQNQQHQHLDNHSPVDELTSSKKFRGRYQSDQLLLHQDHYSSGGSFDSLEHNQMGNHHHDHLARMEPDCSMLNQASMYQQQNSSQYHQSKRRASPVYLFNSMAANEAALAVSEGKYDSMIQYHKSKFGSSLDQEGELDSVEMANEINSQYSFHQESSTKLFSNKDRFCFNKFDY